MKQNSLEPSPIAKTKCHSCAPSDTRPRGPDRTVFAPDSHPTRTSHLSAMLVTMTQYSRALAESRAAHRAYRRALLPARVPRGESPRRTNPLTITELRRRVKAADARLAALHPESERPSVDVAHG